MDPREFYQQFGEPTPDPDVIADLLAEGHQTVDDEWYTCHAAVDQQLGVESGRAGPCNCGRDTRVNRRLAILARPFAAHPDHKGKEWTP